MTSECAVLRSLMIRVIDARKRLVILWNLICINVIPIFLNLKYPVRCIYLLYHRCLSNICLLPVIYINTCSRVYNAKPAFLITLFCDTDAMNERNCSSHRVSGLRHGVTPLGRRGCRGGGESRVPNRDILWVISGEA